MTTTGTPTNGVGGHPVDEAAVDRMDRGRIEALQLSRLRATVDHAWHNSPFWRERLDRADVRPDMIDSVEAYRRLVPTVDKAALLDDQDAAQPYGRRLAVPVEQIRATFLTSGSSGKQQEVHAQTAGDVEAAAQMWQTALRWSGVRPGETAFLMVPIGLTAGPVTLFIAYREYGLQTFAAGALDGVERLELMRRFPPGYFSCSPIYLRRLTRIAKELGIDPRRDFPDLRTIKLGAYGFSLDWVAEMDDFWGATLVDTYASTQAGVGTTCEGGVNARLDRRAMIHLFEHRGLYEIVDPDTGEEVGDGEEGELIVTPFDREAVPLLRFRTGDKVRKLPYTYCDCGRPHNGIESGTITRYDNMIKVRGMNLWTGAIDDIVLGHDAITEYNGVVRINDVGREVVEITVEFAADTPSDVGERGRILAALGAAVKEKTSVKCELVEGDPGAVRQINYKERRWIDRRSDQL